MGLCSSSDEWCRRSVTIENNPGVVKLVDYYLIAGDNIQEVKDKACKVLQKCREQGLAISKPKLEINSTITFAGYIPSPDGIRLDPTKIKAIVEFPSPKDITSLRGFLGMANQIGHFVPNLAALSDPLRQLLKKNVAYQWLPEHEKAFQKMKKVLSKSLSLQHFNPNLKTFLVTDASKLNGLGYVLMQSQSSPTKPNAIIQGGSRVLNAHERNYATIELEA